MPSDSSPQIADALASSLVDASPDCIKLLDVDGTVRFINERGIQLSGLTSADQILGKNMTAAWPVESHAELQTALTEAARGHVTRVEGFAPTATGEPRWWEARFSALRREDGTLQVVCVSRDISSRHESDLALRTLQEELRFTLQAGRFGTWKVDLATGVLTTSPTCRKNFGRDPNAPFTYQDLHDAIHPDDLARMKAAVQDCIDTRLDYDIEYRIVTPQAQVRWVAARGRLVNAPDGRATSLVGISLDIDLQKKTEARRQALVQLGERIRDLDEPAALACAAGEIVGRELGVDRAGYGLVDIRAETIDITRDWRAPGVISLEGQMLFREYGSYINDLKRGVTVAIADVHQDPRTLTTAQQLSSIDARAFVNMPLTERGGLVGLFFVTHGQPRAWGADELAFIRDVAERIQAAIARHEAKQELQRFADSLQRQVEARTYERDRTWTLNQDLLGVANAQGFFESANPAWQHTLGWTNEEIRTTPFRDFVHPDDLAATEAVMGRLNQGERIVNFENRYRTKDGGYRCLSWTAVPERDLIYTAARDITDQKERAAELDAAKDQLRQSQKLEAVGQLTGGVAHDFNNLLQVISSNLHLISRKVAGDETLQRRIGAALSAVDRGAQLSSQLLAFSRRQSLAPKVIDVGDLCLGMEDMLKRAIGEEVTVRTLVSNGLWNAFFDPVQFGNAILNLAINARDAMEGTGQLTIMVANKVLDGTSSQMRWEGVAGEYVMVAVSDTGSGMAPDVIAKAFEPFFTTKPVGRGSGLGLSMVYGFVKQSNGHVEIHSDIGVGTTVKLFLPRSLLAVDAAPQIEGLPSIGGTETVLVVEDDAAVRATAVETLVELGYRVLEAADAAAALEIVERDERIDLLFTDVVMPGKLKSMDLAEIARHRHAGIAVLFTSGYPRDAVVAGGRLDPRMDLLAKPYSRDTFARKVRAALGERRRDAAH